MNRRTSFFVLILICLTLAGAVGRARADDCGGRNVVTIVAPGATWTVELRWNDAEKSWQRRYLGKGHTGDWRPMPHLGEHAHLVVFVPKKGPFFAVLNAAAELGNADRLLVQQTLDGVAPAIFRRYSLEDLLTKDELARVTRSTSHVHWLLGERDPPYRFDADGTTLVLTVMSGRQVRIPIFPER